jgi:hypothetical protein
MAMEYKKFHRFGLSKLIFSDNNTTRDSKYLFWSTGIHHHLEKANSNDHSERYTLLSSLDECR